MIERNILLLIVFLTLPISSCALKKQAINTNEFQKEKKAEEKKRLKFLEIKKPKNFGKELNNTLKNFKQNDLKGIKKDDVEKVKSSTNLGKNFYLNFAIGNSKLKNYDVFNNSTNKAIWDDRYTKLGSSFEIGFGYDFGKVRTELTYIQETGRFDEYLTYFDKSITKIPDDRGKLHKDFYVVNTYFDFRDNRRFSPFIGLGLGFVNSEQGSAPNIPKYVRQAFVSQLKVGLSYKFSDKNILYIEGFNRNANSHTTNDGLGTPYIYKAKDGFDSSGLQIGFRKIL